jgi:dihydrofolate reductase
MTKLKVYNLATSLDGYSAGAHQTLETPMGEGGMALHQWVFATRTGRQMTGQDGGETGIDDDFVAARTVGTGATIMGRNMFGPVRGPWTDDEWQGWWGDEPPFHHQVFVLTHHARPPLEKDGGTTFHFIDAGIEAALELATAAADGQDIVLGGGASTIRQYLAAGLVDEMHIPVVPVLLGAGERIFDGSLDVADTYEVAEAVPSPSGVTHYRLVKK